MHRRILCENVDSAKNKGAFLYYIYIDILCVASIHRYTPSTHVEFNASFMETLQGVKVDLLSPHLCVEETVNIGLDVLFSTID